MAERKEPSNLGARVEAHYQVLSAGLSALRREMHEGFTGTRAEHDDLVAGLGAQAARVDDLAGSVDDLAGSVDDLAARMAEMAARTRVLAGGVHELADSQRELQVSIARVARREAESAARIDAVFEEISVNGERSMRELREVFAALSAQYDVSAEGTRELDDVKERLSAVEHDVDELKKKSA